MVGPGLFLVLALSGVLARAETAVGLDARGVDPMAAVDNRQGLDVRDEMGRPVTAQAVLADLKQASVARAVETAYATALPKARVIVPVLELAAGLGLRLVQLAESLPPPSAWATVPPPGPKLAVLLIVVLGAVLGQVASAFRPRAAMPALSSCRRSFEVLRC